MRLLEEEIQFIFVNSIDLNKLNIAKEYKTERHKWNLFKWLRREEIVAKVRRKIS